MQRDLRSCCAEENVNISVIIICSHGIKSKPFLYYVEMSCIVIFKIFLCRC